MSETSMVHAGQIARDNFEGQEISNPAETSAAALAEREKALIQALFIVADRKRRSISGFEAGLLKECERPGFAEVARYSLPRRKWNPETRETEEIKIEGFSIRFAEAAMRHWTNVFCQQQIVYEDDLKRIVRFTCIDLECNIPLIGEIQLNKTVERKGFKKGNGWTPPAGREVIGQRTNSVGDVIYIVVSTEEELQMKQASSWSKFIRNVLRFMPGDILDAAEDQLDKTLKGQSPEASRERLINAFDKLKVTLTDLQQFLGHALSDATPSELDELRKIYTAVRENQATWKDIVEGKPGPQGTKEAAGRAGIEMLLKAGNENGARAMAKDLKLDFDAIKADFDKKNAPKAQTDNPSQQSASGEKAGANTTGPAESSASSGQGTAEPSPAGGSPAPESKVDPQKDQQLFREAKLKKFRDDLGGEDFWKVVGGAGFEEIPAAAACSQYEAMVKELDQAAADKKKASRKGGRLNL